MEVFLVQDYLSNFKEYANSSPNKEVCGLVVNDIFYSCKNISVDPENFIIDPVDYARVSSLGKIDFICHSHLGLSAKPSQADIYSCNKGSTTWIIYAVESGNLEYYLPNAKTVPLIGREYYFGITDCFSLVTDVYKEELSIELTRPFIQSENWFKEEVNYFEAHTEENNLVKIMDGSLNKYDILLFMAGNSKVPNHSGIKYDGNLFLHHLYGKLSTKEVFGGYWHKCRVATYRHKDLL